MIVICSSSNRSSSSSSNVTVIAILAKLDNTSSSVLLRVDLSHITHSCKDSLCKGHAAGCDFTQAMRYESLNRCTRSIRS